MHTIYPENKLKMFKIMQLSLCFFFLQQSLEWTELDWTKVSGTIATIASIESGCLQQLWSMPAAGYRVT